MVLDKGPLEEHTFSGQRADLSMYLLDTHCYLLLASGPEDATLEMTLFDLADVPWLRDRQQGRDAVLGVYEHICPGQSGARRVVLRWFADDHKDTKHATGPQKKMVFAIYRSRSGH